MSTIDTDIVQHPPTPEAQPSLETPLRRQTHEVKQVGSILVFGKVAEIQQRLKNETEAQKTESMKDAGIKAIASLDELNKLGTGPYKNAKGEEGIGIQEDNPVVLNIDDAPYTAVRIMSGDENNLLCKVKDSKGNIDPEEVPINRDLFVLGQLASEGENIKGLFPPELHEVIDLYFKAVRSGEKGLEGQDAEKVNEAILKAAGKAGVMTVEHVKALMETMPSSDPEEQAKREKALALLQGKNILDGETTQSIVEAFGISPEGLPEQIAQGEAGVAKLRAENADATLIAQAEAQLQIMKTFNTLLGENGVVKKYFAELSAGGMPTEQAQKLLASLSEKSLDLDVVIEQIRPDLADVAGDEEGNKKKKEQRDLLKASMKGLSFGGMLLLIIAGTIGLTAQAVVNVTGAAAK